MQNQQSAQDGVGDGVQRAGGKGSNGEGHETSSDDPLEAPVVAAVGVVWVGHGNGCVHASLDLLGQRGQDLLALGGVEGSDAGGLGHGRARKGRAELVGEGGGGGLAGGRKHTLGRGGCLETLLQQTGTHEGGHCCGFWGAMELVERRGDGEDVRSAAAASKATMAMARGRALWCILITSGARDWPVVASCSGISRVAVSSLFAKHLQVCSYCTAPSTRPHPSHRPALPHCAPH